LIRPLFARTAGLFVGDRHGVGYILHMNRTVFSFAVVFSGLLTPALCQLPQVSAPGVTAKLFGSNTAFIASATTKVIDRQQKETMVMPMTYAFLEGKTRSEVDMAQVRSKDIEAGATAIFKQMGMDRMVTIVRPDKQAIFVVYPGLAAYAETPVSTAEIQMAAVGDEIIDGHPCQKKRLSISSKDGKQEGFVWQATDLKEFPVKIEMSLVDGSIVTTYTGISFEKPDPKLFEPPAAYEKYESVEKMVHIATMKRLPR
jgi:hypothetical protein